jgi:hypothetical protein
MSIIKNSSGPYVIRTINASDPIVLDSGNVIINGNLFARGTSTTISTTNTDIYDNIITLNKGVTGAPILNAGITVVRGTSSNVDLRWNEGTQNWQITNDGSIYYDIVATTTGNTRLVDDAQPQLGANLDVANFAIVNNSGANIYIAPTSELVLDGNLHIKKVAGNPVPSVVNNYNVVIASNVSTGGTGLYVTNDEGITNQELISKSRAIVYSIIF